MPVGSSGAKPLREAAFEHAAHDPTLPDLLKLNAPEKVPVQLAGAAANGLLWTFHSVRVDPIAQRYYYRFQRVLGSQSLEWEVPPWSPSGSPPFEPTIDGSVEILKLRARETWRQIANRFEEAAAAGLVTVLGRIGSPLASVAALPAEAWRHLRIEDWESGVATGDPDLVIYGLHIAPATEALQSGVEGAEGPRKGSLARNTRKAINELYPSGEHKKLSDKELLRAVHEHMSNADSTAKLPGLRTVRRAAGRDAK